MDKEKKVREGENGYTTNSGTKEVSMPSESYNLGGGQNARGNEKRNWRHKNEHGTGGPLREA